MLFAYKTLPSAHAIDKLQEYVDYIFYDVWCKAPEGLEFGQELFANNGELSNIVNAFGYSKNKNETGKQFFNRIKEIYGCFRGLSSVHVESLKQWYEANNNIELACTDANTPIARYDNINTINVELCEKLKEFFTSLWDHKLLGAAAIRNTVGTIDSHYKEFMDFNNTGVCPFCGLSDMLGKDSSNREAYDHYLPKSEYPFNSLNFKNLFPACDNCNSKSKTTKDPLHKGNTRRKAFYPFSQTHTGIKVSVSLKTTDMNQLTSRDVTFTFGPSSKQEEIDVWREIYKIDERYAAKIAQMKYIFEDIRHATKNGICSQEEYYRIKLEECDRNPFQERQFLKKAFLKACNSKGLFNAPPSSS